MKTISGIYKIQSTIKPERIYIGSAVNIYKRWSKHLGELKSNAHHSIILQNHFNKYGISDLQFSVLLGCEINDLIKTEQYFIDSWNPYFNICRIAGNCSGIKQSELTKQKKRDKQLGKKASQETRLKISNSMKGHKGHKFTDEQKRNISESKKGTQYKQRR
jgi:group I intron endonuclease